MSSSSLTRRARRSIAAVAGLVVASVALTGCLYAMIPETGSRPTASLAPDTEGISAELLPFYEQELEWAACDGAGGGFDCTTVTAPLDWQNPDAGEIELAVIRHQATGGAPLGSLLTNPGGPGASGYDIVRDAVTFVVGQELAAAYDVIGFDPRGVGRSTAVACLDAPEMDAYLFDIRPGARGSEEWEQASLAEHAEFAEACEANSDGILEYITTDNAARDMDLLRGVLGDPKLNYLGYSYGTFLGATYAQLFPERVGRLVLDGAIDPSTSNLQVSTTQALGFESALRAYMADCLTQQECPFRGTVDEGMADLGVLLASVDRRPIEAVDGRMLGADSLTTAIVSALYAQESWPLLTQAFTQVLEGDPEVAFYLADSYYGRTEGIYADNSTEAFRAYNCMDYPATDTPEDIATANALLAREAPTIAPYWEGPNPCDVWPYPATGVREPIAADGAAPILVIGTTNDPATPYEWAVALADQLSSGVLITRVGEGHTGFNKGNACVDAAVVSYLIDGIVPADDVTCE